MGEYMSKTVYDGFLSQIYDYCPYFGRDREQTAKYYISKLSDIPRADVLEIGTATGSITIPILTAGYYVDTVDYSNDMHKIVRRKLKKYSKIYRKRINFILSDVTRLRLYKKYDAIIIPDSLLAIIDTSDQLNHVLQICYNALNDGGILLFDIYKPVDNLLEGDEYIDAARFRDENGDVYVVEARHKIDKQQQKQTTLYYYKKRVDANRYIEVASIEIIYYYKYLIQIKELLKEIGFRDIETSEIFDNAIYFVSAKK